MPDVSDDLPVLGAMSDDEAMAKLAEFEGEDAEELDDDAIEAFAAQKSIRSAKFPFFSRQKPYMYTAHAFGYIAPDGGGQLVAAGQLKPDKSLTRVNLRLNALRVASYPGSGMHHVLFDFYAENHVGGSVETAHFSQVYRATEGQSAGIVGYPIFIGVNVGPNGIAFRCFTVNVKNDADEKFLGFLDSDVFKQGLRLASTAQPALAPFSTMAVGLAKAIGARNRNVKVQDFYMGLDFHDNAAGARLATGDYVAVQIPDSSAADWDWTQWYFDAGKGTIVAKDDRKTLIPYNYVGFSVTAYNE